MVYAMEQTFNSYNSTTYTPQPSTLLNAHPSTYASSPYYTSSSNSSFEYTGGVYHPTRHTAQSAISNTSLGYDNHLGQYDSSSPASSYQSFDAPASPSPSSSNRSPYYHQNQIHRIHEIQVSHGDIATYVSYPTIEDLRIGWRPDFLKCNYPGCNSTAIDPSKLHAHLALHLNSRKAYGCSCGTTFGRLSEANRHKNDQNPCEICGDSRRKQKGTNTCSRCFTVSSSSSMSSHGNHTDK